MGQLKLKEAEDLLSEPQRLRAGVKVINIHKWRIGVRARIPGSPPGPESSPHPTGRALSYLKWEPLVSYNGRLGPIDDFREGQLPARAEKHRDAASLGGRGVTGEPSPNLHTLSPPLCCTGGKG